LKIAVRKNGGHSSLSKVSFYLAIIIKYYFKIDDSNPIFFFLFTGVTFVQWCTNITRKEYYKQLKADAELLRKEIHWDGRQPYGFTEPHWIGSQPHGSTEWEYVQVRGEGV